jgi:hypothetical protein
MREGDDPADEVIAAAILRLTGARAGSICPSEAARAVAAADWRALMPRVRAAAARLAAEGTVVVTQRGVIVDAATAQGPIRIALRGGSPRGDP